MENPSLHSEDGKPADSRIITPARWLAEKYPQVPEKYGVAILEKTEDKVVLAKSLNEDFLAASLGELGSPGTPTVFVPTEERFYTYSPDAGVFEHHGADKIIAGLSQLLLECARACKRDSCDVKALEFGLRSSAKLSGVLRKARGILQAPPEYFANDLTTFIPCANGMLRLDDKTLLPFNPSYRRRNKLAVPFDPTGKCPLFLDTLMRPALGDEDLDLLQRACGMFLTGENLAQRIFILTGTAGGGKGTFIRVLTGVVGDVNMGSLRTQFLGERFELSRFLGKTLLYGADVPQNFLNQRGASVLKSLTGGDPVALEFKNSNESPVIVCKFNVIVTRNSRLTVHLEGDTGAWRRRLAIIEYRRPKAENVIADLDKRILTRDFENRFGVSFCKRQFASLQRCSRACLQKVGRLAWKGNTLNWQSRQHCPMTTRIVSHASHRFKILLRIVLEPLHPLPCPLLRGWVGGRARRASLAVWNHRNPNTEKFLNAPSYEVSF